MTINSKATLGIPGLLPPSDAPNGDHKCPMEKCGKVFESLDDLTRHDSICHPCVGMARVNKHPEGAVLPCPCPIPGCSRTFETSFSVNSHIKQTHGVDPWKDPAGVQAMIAGYNSLLQPKGNFPAVHAGSASYSNSLQQTGYIPDVQVVNTSYSKLQSNGNFPGAQAVSASYSNSLQPNGNTGGIQAMSMSYSNSLLPNAYLPDAQAVIVSYINNFQPNKSPDVFQSVSSNNSNNNGSPGPCLVCYCPEPGCGRAFETPYSVGLHHKQVHSLQPYRKPRSVQGVNSNHSTKTASATSSPPIGFSESIGQNVILQSAPRGQPLNFDFHNFNPETMESVFGPKNSVRTKNPSSEMDSAFPYQCHLCGVHDRDYRKYHMHMTQAHPNEDMLLKFRCFVEGCNRSFEQKGKRLSHVEVDHPGAKLKCPGCPSTYAGEPGIWLHIRKEHSPIGQGYKYRCHHCTSSFVLPSDLKRHAGTMHGEWGCSYSNCEWYFGTAKELDDHWNEKHGRKAPVWLFNSRKVLKENPRQVPAHRRLGDMSVQKEPTPISWNSMKSQNPPVDGFGSPINYIRTIGSTGGENSFMSGPSGSQNVSYASPEPGLSGLPVRRENPEPVFYRDFGNSIKSESQAVPAGLGINENSEDGKIRLSHDDHQDHYGYQQPNYIDSSMAMGDNTGDDWRQCPVTPPYKEKHTAIDPTLLNPAQFQTASSHVPRSGVPGGVDVDGRQSALETLGLPRRGLGASSFTIPPSDILGTRFDGSNSQKGLLPVSITESTKKLRKFGATDFANLPLEEKKVDINEWFQKATAKCAPEDMRYYSPESSSDDENLVEETEHCGETYWTADGRRALETLKSNPDGSTSPFYPRSVHSSPKPPSSYTLSKLALPHTPKIVSPKPPAPKARPQNQQVPLKASKGSTSKNTTMSSNGKDNRDLKPSEHHFEPMRFVAGTTIPGLQPRGRGRPRKREREETTVPTGQPVTKKPTVRSEPAPMQATAMDSRRDVGDFDRPRVVPPPVALVSEKDRRETLGLKGESGRQKIRVVNSKQVRAPTSIRIKDSRANTKATVKPTVKSTHPDDSDMEIDDDEDDYIEDMFGGRVKRPTTNSIADISRHAANVAASSSASSGTSAGGKGKEKESRKHGGRR